MYMNNTLILSAATALLVALASCHSKTEAADPKDDRVCVSDSLARMISIDSAFISQVNDQVKLSGEVSFNDNKVVRIFPFSGGQVQKVMVSLGDRVRRGQTLAVIKSADVAGNYSDLSVANTDIAIAKKQMDNQESLFKNGITSEREYTEAKENYNKAVSNAEKIKTQIAINGGGQTDANGMYVIKSPIDGYVVEKNAEAGGFIRGDNSQNLFTIGDIKQVWIWANVYEADVSRVRTGYEADVTTLAYPGRVFKGKIDEQNEILDPQSKVMKIRIALQNDSLLLKPEMFASVIIRSEEKTSTVTIPATAVVNDNGKTFVVVYHDRCDLELRSIEVSKTFKQFAYIKSGLQAGEKVISHNQILLYRALLED